MHFAVHPGIVLALGVFFFALGVATLVFRQVVYRRTIDWWRRIPSVVNGRRYRMWMVVLPAAGFVAAGAFMIVAALGRLLT